MIVCGFWSGDIIEENGNQLSEGMKNCYKSFCLLKVNTNFQGLVNKIGPDIVSNHTLHLQKNKSIFVRTSYITTILNEYLRIRDINKKLHFFSKVGIFSNFGKNLCIKCESLFFLFLCCRRKLSKYLQMILQSNSLASISQVEKEGLEDQDQTQSSPQLLLLTMFKSLVHRSTLLGSEGSEEWTEF